MLPNSIRNAVLELRAIGLTVNLLYLIPTGHNPLGNTIPLYRKREIYQVCHDLNLIIIEDDAYYYLYYGEKYEQCHHSGGDSYGTTSSDHTTGSNSGVIVDDAPGIKGLPRYNRCMDDIIYESSSTLSSLPSL